MLQENFTLMIANISRVNDILNLHNNSNFYFTDNLIVSYRQEIMKYYKKSIYKRVILIDDNSLKALYLNNYIYEKQILPNLLNKSVVIIDEFDSLYTPLSSDLNYPNINTVLSDTSYLSYKIIDNIVNTLNKMVTENITLEYNSQTILEYCSKMYDEKDRTELLKYCELHKVINDVGKMEYNRKYGLPINNSHTHKNYAVPYSFVNTPIIGSEFSEFDIKLVLTVLCHLKEQNTLSESLIKEMCNYIANQVDSVINFLNYEDIVKPYKSYLDILNINSREHLESVTEKHLKETISNISVDNKIKLKMFVLKNILIPNMIISENFYRCSFIDILKSDFCKYKCGFSGTLSINLPYYNNYLLNNRYTLSKIQNKVTNAPENYYLLYNEDTNSNIKSEITNVIYNRLDEMEIKTAIYGCIGDHNYKKNTYFTLHDNTTLDELINILFYKNDLVYDSLIDCGAFFKQFSNFNVANHIINKCMINNIDVDVIYIEYDKLTNYDKVYILKIFNKKINNSEYNPKNTLFNKKTFIYYDNKHTVGVDIKQPYNMAGLCTIKKNTLTDISQGIFRLRDLNYGHYVDFIIDDKEKLNIDDKHIINGRIKLYEYLAQNEKKSILNNDRKLKEQCLLSLLKNKSSNTITIPNYIYYSLIKDIKTQNNVYTNFFSNFYNSNKKKCNLTNEESSYVDTISKILTIPPSIIDINIQVNNETITQQNQNLALKINEEIEKEMNTGIVKGTSEKTFISRHNVLTFKSILDIISGTRVDHSIIHNDALLQLLKINILTSCTFGLHNTIIYKKIDDFQKKKISDLFTNFVIVINIINDSITIVNKTIYMQLLKINNYDYVYIDFNDLPLSAYSKVRINVIDNILKAKIYFVKVLMGKKIDIISLLYISHLIHSTKNININDFTNTIYNCSLGTGISCISYSHLKMIYELSPREILNYLTDNKNYKTNIIDIICKFYTYGTDKYNDCANKYNLQKVVMNGTKNSNVILVIDKLSELVENLK